MPIASSLISSNFLRLSVAFPQWTPAPQARTRTLRDGARKQSHCRAADRTNPDASGPRRNGIAQAWRERPPRAAARAEAVPCRVLQRGGQAADEAAKQNVFVASGSPSTVHAEMKLVFEVSYPYSFRAEPSRT